jgi:hypothetical protein
MRRVHRSVVLLLTATIDPGATYMVTRSDSLTRLGDYEHSLGTWLSSGSVDKIVFYENSGYDLSSLKKIALQFPSREVEFHSFLGNQNGTTRGKGYSELAGILRTIEESELITQNAVVAKCTGRLTVRNARKLFDLTTSSDFDVMCTLKNYLTFADSRLFVATPEFITQYLGSRQEMISDIDGIFLEHALACATMTALADRKKWLPLPLYPDIRGISGTYGTSLTNRTGVRVVKSLYHRLKNSIYEN